MFRALLPALLFGGLVACGDSDDDGLSDAQEKDLGTDPENPDTDGDGLADSDEVDLGSDPLATDSDADGYGDGDEIAAGTDPLDEADRIYTGGWPYNRDKDAIVDPGWDGDNDVGDVVPRFAFVDQYDESVDIYDFAGDKTVVIEVCQVGRYWCEETAKLLQDEPSQFDAYGYDEFVSLVNDGTIYWVFVLDGEVDSDAEISTAARDAWMADFPNEHVPVLMDPERELTDWLNLRDWPAAIVVDGDMTVTMIPGTSNDLFESLQNRY